MRYRAPDVRSTVSRASRPVSAGLKSWSRARTPSEIPRDHLTARMHRLAQDSLGDDLRIVRGPHCANLSPGEVGGFFVDWSVDW